MRPPGISSQGFVFPGSASLPPPTHTHRTMLEQISSSPALASVSGGRKQAGLGRGLHRPPRPPPKTPPPEPSGTAGKGSSCFRAGRRCPRRDCRIRTAAKRQPGQVSRPRRASGWRRPRKARPRPAGSPSPGRPQRARVTRRSPPPTRAGPPRSDRGCRVPTAG